MSAVIKYITMFRIHIPIPALYIVLIFKTLAGPPAFAAEPPWTEIHAQHFSIIGNNHRLVLRINIHRDDWPL